MQVDTSLANGSDDRAVRQRLIARHVSEAVAQWLPRVRHVIHQTNDRILVFGCLVTKNLDPTGRIKNNKRLLFWESDRELRHVRAEIPADIRLIIRMHWAAHPLVDSILKQARARNITVTDILLPSDVKYLLGSSAFATDDQIRERIETIGDRAKDDPVGIALAMTTLAPEVLKMEPVPEPTPPETPRKSLKPGELRAWLAPRANFEAARTDRSAEAKRLIDIANAERFPTTEGSIDTTLANMIRKMDTPEPAPLPPIPPPPAWSPTPKAPTPKPTTTEPTPPEPTPLRADGFPVDAPPIATSTPPILPREGSTIAEVVQFIDSAIGALQTVREAVLKLPANMETEVKREVKRRIEDRIMKAMQANEETEG